MRFLLHSLLATLALGASQGEAATRNFGINSFDRIRIEGPYKVTLTTGVPPFAAASGSPAALDRVAIEVQGRTLLVHASRSSWGGYPGESPGPVEVRVGTHELSQASVNGSGTLAIDKVKGLDFNLFVAGSGLIAIGQADVDQLRVNIAGTAGAVISGTAAKLTATIRGLSSLDASGLNVKDAALGADGAGTIKAKVTNSATIDGSGPATFVLTGNPACTSRIDGSASVSGCR